MEIERQNHMDKIRIDLVTKEVTINCSTPCSPLSSDCAFDATQEFIVHNGYKLIYINVHNLSTSKSERPMSPIKFEQTVDFETFLQSPSWPSISNPYSDGNISEESQSCSPSSSSSYPDTISKSASTPWILYNGIANSDNCSFSLSQSITPCIDNDDSILHINLCLICIVCT